jgi:ligand-binding sensor domain-containing protein/signal transduction histidine kinase
MRRCLETAFLCAFVLVTTTATLAGTSPPGRLPLRTYTTLDGLADDGVSSLLEDSRGYLWIATNAGVSRFDGSRFVNSLEDSGGASQVAEAPDGAIWAATGEGLFREDPHAPAGPDAFRQVTAGAFSTVHVDAAGEVWAGSGSSVVRVRAEGDRFEITRERIESPFANAPIQDIRRIASDSKGRLWIATHWGLVCRLPDGRQVHYEPVRGVAERAFDVAVDGHGRIWVGSQRLQVLVPPDEPPPFPAGSRIALVRGLWARALTATAAPAPDGRLDVPDRPGEARVFEESHGLAGEVLFGAVTADRHGRIWIGTTGGLNVLEDDRLSSYGPAQGVPRGVTAIVEDRAGDLWFGTGVDGLRRWRRRGFVAFGQVEGLDHEWIAALMTARDGRLVAATRPPLGLSAIEAGSIRPTPVRLPASIVNEGWGWGQIVAQDHAGNLWLGSEGGLFEVPPRALDASAPVAGEILDARNGLGSEHIFRIFIDSRDRLWASTFVAPGRPPSALTCVELPKGTVRAYSTRDGTPGTASAIAESPDGSIWFGLYNGGLVREENGHFRTYGQADGVPDALVASLWFGSKDVLWAATEGRGLLRVAIHGGAVDIRRFTREDGLSSDVVKAVLGGGDGSLWLGTMRGVDRFEPGSGRVESFTTADGLPVGFVLELARDRLGRLWVGTAKGIARFEPGEVTTGVGSSTVLITQVEVDGAPVAVPALGSPLVGSVEVPGERSRVRIAFTAPGTGRGAPPAFQYRLSGLDDAWSPSTGHDEVTFASLPSGRHRFEVRLAAAGDSGTAAEAVVMLRVPTPLWRRPWLLALSAVTAFGVGVLLHRARLRRALALERQRTRIAMDLHDEIGSGLGSIGLMADIAHSDDVSETERRGLTAQMGAAATELGSSLAELVGTLRPGGASLESLAKQLAERGRRLFPGTATRFTTSFPDAWPVPPLDLAVRRDVFLVGAEALHNAARHAGATAVRLALAFEGSRWLLTIEDDGRGIDAGAAESAGLGLRSMKARAERIGAEFRIEPLAGGGTRVLLRF